MTLVALRLYYRLTGSCLSYCPDAHGVCRVCRVPGAGYTDGPLRNEKEANIETYKIIRGYQDDRYDAELIATGLTLAEARAHCNDPETSSSTAAQAAGVALTRERGSWFDRYESE